jgi:hypothetical protein
MKFIPYATYQWAVIIWILLAVFIFPLLLKVTAPYGRHTRSGWGLMMSNRWAWFIMELPALLIPILFYLAGGLDRSIVSWIFLAVFSSHYINRSLIYPFRQKSFRKKMPVLIMASALFFNLVNGSVIGYYFGLVQLDVPLEWLWDIRFIAGFFLFLTGMLINLRSDDILLALRKPGETDYKIPFGGMFRYISCPNHFGEIVEWTGFAIMTWSLPGLSFAIWTAANLIPRALDHHKWYLGHFNDYPSERKAVIPFLW